MAFDPLLWFFTFSIDLDHYGFWTPFSTSGVRANGLDWPSIGGMVIVGSRCGIRCVESLLGSVKVRRRVS